MSDPRFRPATRWWLAALFVVVAMGSATGAPSAPIPCRFEVQVPAGTPALDQVFVIGNQPALGDWKGTGVALERVGPHLFQFRGAFPPGTRLEFKFSRGDFARIEKSAAGHEIPNRHFEVVGSGPMQATFQVAAWADQIGTPAPSITGSYELLKDFPSKILGNTRSVWVLLPSSYRTPSGRGQRYPVLYMHDGNNLFDPGTSFGGVDWGVDETVDQLTRTGQMREIIVVAVGNTSARMDEYTPFPDPKHAGGKGDLYGRFLVEELKPAIDARFRTLSGAAATAIGGSSLGGLISLYLGLRHPDVFGGIISMSPSYWWAEGGIIPWAIAQKPDPAHLRLWVDIGLAEGGEALTFCRQFHRAWHKAFHGVRGYVYREIPLAGHNEAAWRARFAQPLLFLYGSARAARPAGRNRANTLPREVPR